MRAAIFAASLLISLCLAPAAYGEVNDDMTSLTVALEHDPQYLDIDSLTNLGAGIDDLDEVVLNVQDWPSNLTDGSYAGATFRESILEIEFTPSSVSDTYSFFATGQPMNFSVAQLLNGATQINARLPFVGDDFILTWLTIFELSPGGHNLTLDPITFVPEVENGNLIFAAPLINPALPFDYVNSFMQSYLNQFGYDNTVWPYGKVHSGTIAYDFMGDFFSDDNERHYYKFHKFLYPATEYYFCQSVWLNETKPKLALTEENPFAQSENATILFGETYADETNQTKNITLSLSAGWSFVFEQGQGDQMTGVNFYKPDNQALFFRTYMSRPANGSENVSLMLPFINRDNKDLNVTFKMRCYNSAGAVWGWETYGGGTITNYEEQGPLDYRNFILFTPSRWPVAGAIRFDWYLIFNEPSNLTLFGFDSGGNESFFTFEGTSALFYVHQNASYHNFSLYHSLQYTVGAWVMVATDKAGDITILDPRFPVVIGTPARFDLELAIDNGNIETVNLFDEALTEWSQIDLRDPLAAIQHILNGVAYFIGGTLQAVRDEANAITGWVRGGFGWLKDQLDSLGEFVYLGLMELKKLILSLIPDIIDGIELVVGALLTVLLVIIGRFMVVATLTPTASMVLRIFREDP